MLKEFEDYGYVIKNGILFFAKGPLSQWWGALPKQLGGSILEKGGFLQGFNIEYNCAEQWMMAKKAALFKDWRVFHKVMNTTSPREQKDLGKEVKNFDQRVWDQHKQVIVKEGNMRKFTQNALLAEFLMRTEDLVLAEAAPWDKVWGIGMSADDENAEMKSLWKGQNLLGYTLMEVRDFLKENFELDQQEEEPQIIV